MIIFSKVYKMVATFLCTLLLITLSFLPAPAAYAQTSISDLQNAVASANTSFYPYWRRSLCKDGKAYAGSILLGSGKCVPIKEIVSRYPRLKACRGGAEWVDGECKCPSGSKLVGWRCLITLPQEAIR